MNICILHIGHSEPGEKTKFSPSPVRFQAGLEPLLPHVKWSVISAVVDDLPDPDQFDAYLITGGKYSVFEKYDWQTNLLNFIRELNARLVPLVGVCYGHQAIAHALNGKVSRSEKGWGVGLMPHRVTQETNFASPESEIYLHAMHQDQVTGLPDGADIFLSSDFCPISGFTVGSHFFAIQQHPDFTADLSEELIRRRFDRIGPTATAAIQSLKGQDDTSKSLVWIADFLRFALGSKEKGKKTSNLSVAAT